ncbi:MAG TPA: exodeoxyribonuclease VII large subunit [Vicinamibacterales bacterium]|nr:exodeoxyribonuclease VII large subunit [Vicinamibacterales bacterium]
MTNLFDLPFEEEPEPEPEPAPAPEMRRPFERPPGGTEILTVGQLTADIRNVLEGQFTRVAVEGELSNCRAWNGQLYFTLKDSSAQLRVVMFRTSVRLLHFRPEDGQHVVARGRISVYEPKGEYQLICDRLEPHGLGALQLAFEQLKKRLAEEGLFDERRKRPIPALPRKIGIVTSLDAAALRDILKVLRTRHPHAHVVIRPARVQGDGAAQDLARALAAIGRVPGIDVVIIGRGGGSIEDLWAFNEETVARAIVRCPVPVISAVGHETDFTIADFAADHRAPTPSAAAAFVASRYEDVCARLARQRERLVSAAGARVLRLRSRLQRLESAPAFAGWPGRLAMRGRHVAETTHALQRAIRLRLDREARRLAGVHNRLEARDLRRRVGLARRRLAQADGGIRAAFTRIRHLRQARFAELAGRLDSLSPLAVLGRGYALCWDAAAGTLVRDASSLAPGHHVRVVVSRGAFEAAVTKTETAKAEG